MEFFSKFKIQLKAKINKNEEFIGPELMEYFTSFFSNGAQLNRLRPLRTDYKEMREYFPLSIHISLIDFRFRLKRYCDLMGYVYNPNKANDPSFIIWREGIEYYMVATKEFALKTSFGTEAGTEDKSESPTAAPLKKFHIEYRIGQCLTQKQWKFSTPLAESIEATDINEAQYALIMKKVMESVQLKLITFQEKDL